LRSAAPAHASALLWVLAASSLLYLYPAGDFWHVIMTVPMFLPLIALQLDRAQRVEPPPAPRRRRPNAFAVAAVAVLALLAAPPVLSLLTTRAQLANEPPRFARARGIVGLTKYRDAADLVDFLDTQQPAQRPLFITANEQMLYFLSGRVSALDRYEFVFYLTAAGLIRDA